MTVFLCPSDESVEIERDYNAPLYVLLIVTLLNVFALQVEPLPVTPIDEHLFVVTECLPAEINTDTIADLYHLLEQHVVSRPDSPFATVRDCYPIVVHFVPADSYERFPEGTEGFAGMVDFAHWDCTYAGSDLHCSLSALTSDQPKRGDIILVIVVDTGCREETYGLIAHELTHVLGAVDGTLCPADEDYRLSETASNDLGDAYWWYGVTGFFELRPSGIIWEALNDNCATSPMPDLCVELAAVFDGSSPSNDASG